MHQTQYANRILHCTIPICNSVDIAYHNTLCVSSDIVTAKYTKYLPLPKIKHWQNLEKFNAIPTKLGY